MERRRRRSPLVASTPEAVAPRAPEQDARAGLSADEAARRLAERPPAERAASRSYASIVRANVFTVFNLILLLAGIATLAFGEWQDALFLGVLVANSSIGITQEIRAKRALDRLESLVAPTADVVRDGAAARVPVDEVVVGDLVRAGPGDQIAADGCLVEASGLAIDESILTGESRAVRRGRGEPVRSGAFVVEGVGSYEVTATGGDSYAARITGEARAFRHPRSPLERSINRLLLVLVGVIVPLGLILGAALWERRTPLSTAVPTSVAAVVTLVPEGLILLASLTYAVAALRMARRGALAQQLNAVESLASVDVVCLDKTGTLTDPRLRVVEIVSLDGDDVAGALARYAAANPVRNATLEAIAEELPSPPDPADEVVPFASRRRYGATRFGTAWWVLGAPELFELGPLAARAADEAANGRRVVAFGVTGGDPAVDVPDGVQAGAIVVLSERLRPNARRTVDFFLRQGVELRVLSGDRTETVRAVAAEVGIPVTDETVVGRVTPERKREVVEELGRGGRYVAMVGDGVNDVPALKAARLAIAQGTGTQMARAVADIVLVGGDFDAVPAMVDEGRKILRNLQRVAKLFVTKSAFASVVVLSVGLTTTPYPLLPRHLTLAAGLTIGIPAFFLALAPSAGPIRSSGFLRDVARFAVPAGSAAALGVISSYLFAFNVLDLRLIEARTVATTALVAVGLYLIVALEAEGRRRSAAVLVLVTSLAAAYVLVLALPFTREFFALSVLGPAGALSALVGAAGAATGLVLTDDRFLPGSLRGR
jgi:cation-transporting ATPase E